MTSLHCATLAQQLHMLGSPDAGFSFSDGQTAVRDDTKMHVNANIHGSTTS